MEEEIINLEQREEIIRFSTTVYELKREIAKVIVGQDETINLMLTGLLSNGHILIEGVPGIAKTLLAKMLAQTLTVSFNRIQFTPDLMPTDVTGTLVFNMQKSEFTFNRGPIFANLVLIDEINRSPAKTQASLFEVMEERQITMEGQTYQMDFPFFVIATQNPIEQEGTYKLPEAQLDRFIFRIRMQYPSLEQEIKILQRFKEDFNQEVVHNVRPLVGPTELKSLQKIVEKIYIKDEIIEYIAKIIHTSRNHGAIYLGASPRASLSIMKTAKAMAALSGRHFVIPEDVRKVAIPVLNHRILLTPEKEMEGLTADMVIDEITQSIEVPR
jgi:MoxR-like ATPase